MLEKEMSMSKLKPLLEWADGSAIENADEWRMRAREYKALIEECMLGSAPCDHNVRGDVVSRKKLQDGRAIYEIVDIHYGPELKYSFHAHILRPAREGRFPVITFNMFTNGYGCPAAEEAIERGYVVAMFDKEQLFHDEWTHRTDAKDAYPGYTWGAIRIWAWGHSKLLDFLETQDYADTARAVVTGHSRGGKAALTAGVFDERFAIVAPINSGCGGAGCFRVLGDRHGENGDAKLEESLGRIASVFPHWWREGFAKYGNEVPPHGITREHTLPFDLDAFKALVAPRALFTLEGMDDTWSNPYGSYITWHTAQPVFDIMGAPENNCALFREGGHKFDHDDWVSLMDYCDYYFFGKGKPYWNNGDKAWAR